MKRECVRKRGENSPSWLQIPPKKHMHKSVCSTLTLPRVPRCRIWDRLCFRSLNMRSKALILGRETTLNTASVFSPSLSLFLSLSIFPIGRFYWLQCQTHKKEKFCQSPTSSLTLSFLIMQPEYFQCGHVLYLDRCCHGRWPASYKTPQKKKKRRRKISISAPSDMFALNSLLLLCTAGRAEVGVSVQDYCRCVAVL